MDSTDKVREIGLLEGRAEAAEEIATLHARIAELYRQLEQHPQPTTKGNDDAFSEDMIKKIMAKTYSSLKAEFSDDANVVQRCKSCIRKVTEDIILHGVAKPVRRHSKKRPASQPVVSSSSTSPLVTPELIDQSHSHRKLRPASSNRIDERELVPRYSFDRVQIAQSSKEGEGRHAYVAYIVENSTGDKKALSRRRFRDFHTLFKRLSQVYPIVCIPTLPKKEVFRNSSKFAKAFVDKRQRNLQLWLRYVSFHGLLRDSVDLAKFYHAGDSEWNQHVTKPAVPLTDDELLVVTEVGSIEDAKLPLHMMHHQVENDQLLARQCTHLEKRIREEIPSLQSRLSKAIDQANNLMQCFMNRAKAYSTFETSLMSLANFDEPNEENTSGTGHMFKYLKSIIHGTAESMCHMAELVETQWVEPLQFQGSQTLPALLKTCSALTSTGDTSRRRRTEHAVSEWIESQRLRRALICQDGIIYCKMMLAEQRVITQSWDNLGKAVLGDETFIKRILDASEMQDNHALSSKAFFFQKKKSTGYIDSHVEFETVVEEQKLEHPSMGRPTIPEEVRRTPKTLQVQEDLPCEDSDGSPFDLFGSSRNVTDASVDVSESPKHAAEEEPQRHTKWDAYIQKQRDKQRKQQRSQMVRRVPIPTRKPVGGKRKGLRLHQKVALKRGGRTFHTNSAEDDDTRKEDTKGEQEIMEDDNVTSSQASTPDVAASSSCAKNAVQGGWIAVETEDGRKYYYHKLTRATRWEKPDAAVLETMEERILKEQEEMHRRIELRRQERTQQLEREEDEASRAADIRRQIDEKVTIWSTGKSFVDLLRTLPQIISSIDPKDASRLDIPRNADSVDVKRAYKQAVRLVHPDKNVRGSISENLLGQALFTLLTSGFESYKHSINK